jgi:hypothetical protein
MVLHDEFGDLELKVKILEAIQDSNKLTEIRNLLT